jgi:hypothetical protein
VLLVMTAPHPEPTRIATAVPEAAEG